MFLMLFYIMLGTVLEGFSMIVLTLPIVLPLVQAAGYDKVWFGVFLTLTIEMAQVSPPVAFNLFVIQNLTGDSQSLRGLEGAAVLPHHVRLRGADHDFPRHRDLAGGFHPVALGKVGGSRDPVTHCSPRAAAISSRPENSFRGSEMAKFGIGQAVRRVEDRVSSPGRGAMSTTSCCPACVTVWCCFRRTRMPASRRSTSSKAKAAPGVLLVLTGADAAADKLGAYTAAMMPEDIGAAEGSPDPPAGAAGREGALRRRPRGVRRGRDARRRRATPPI